MQKAASHPTNMALTTLPAEIIVKILQCLPAVDLVSVALTNTKLYHLYLEESVWIARAFKDYGVILKVSDEFSPRLFYQSVLHVFRHSIGCWQRLNLKYYSSLLKVSVQEESLVFSELIPPHKLDQPFKYVNFLRVSRQKADTTVRIENLSKIAPSNRIKIIAPDCADEESDLKIILSDIEDHTLNPSEWREIMLEFMMLMGGQVSVNDVLLMKFIQTYHSRALYSYRKLNLSWPSCPELPLQSGLFFGNYGSHGTEVIELNVTSLIAGTVGRKVTGDPNVPFGEISFRLHHEKCLNIPAEVQDSLVSLSEFLDNPIYLDYQAGLKLDFVVPSGCIERQPIPFKSCIGRWSCECQVAEHGFRDPSFISGNFILFSEDVFAVLFLGINSISLFKRVENPI